MRISQSILIILKNETELKRISLFLRNEGYDVYCKSDPLEALDLAFELLPDLILCETDIWPVNGYQVLNTIRKNPLTESTQFILMPKTLTKEEMILGLELSADDFIHVGDSLEEIKNTINRRIIRSEKFVKLKNTFGYCYDVSPIGIFLFNRTRIYKANYAFYQLTGFPMEENRTIEINELFYSDSYTTIERNIIKCETGIENCHFEKVEINSSKREKQFSFFMHTYSSSQGKVFFIGILVPNKQIYNHQPKYFPNYYPFAKTEEQLFDIDLSKSGTKNQYKNLDGFITDNQFIPVQLSKREKEILQLSCKGIPIKQIADKLSISDRTVEKHRTQIMEKTGSKNIIEVILYSLKNSLVEL